MSQEGLYPSRDLYEPEDDRTPLVTERRSDEPSYLPRLRTRLAEVATTIRTVWNPPAFAWPERAALVVLDPIEAYRGLYSAQAIANVQRLIDGAFAMGVPIVVSQWTRVRPVAPAQDDAIDRKGHWTFYIPSREQSALLRELRVPDGVQKVCVRHTNLFMERASWSVPAGCHLVLCGSWTESCVINTARAALDHGHGVTVVSNACAGHVPSALLALYSIQLAYGDVRQL